MHTTYAVPAQVRRTAPDTGPEALLAAVDADADALADRLHDGALQALVVARYAADAAVRGGDPLLARDAVQEALVALRQAVWELRPRGADDLCTALRELSQRRPEPLDLRLDEDVAARLSPPRRALAYRFVQATASGTATVTDEGGLAAVAGDGPPEDLPGWTARAAAVGGHLDLGGPTARLLLPLHDAPDTTGDAR